MPPTNNCLSIPRSHPLLFPRVPSKAILRAQRSARFFSRCRSHAREHQPFTASKRLIDNKRISHIQDNVELYRENCIQRNYNKQGESLTELLLLYSQWQSTRSHTQVKRQSIKAIQNELSNGKDTDKPQDQKQDAIDSRGIYLREQLQETKRSLAIEEKQEGETEQKITSLLDSLPNLTHPETPTHHPRILKTSTHPKPTPSPQRDHILLGRQFNLLDFEESTTLGGWGSYTLSNSAVKLEQALVSYAQDVAQKHGFELKKPPTMVYSDLVSACGFQPRDQHNEQQIYEIRQSESEERKGKPSLSLAATAEIPFAGMKANQILKYEDLPLKIVGPSVCYRAEAGAHGQKSRGLYRVHEFTKVEMFAWTAPGKESATFDLILAIQTEILDSLNLHYRILEMPAHDLGAAAYRKVDIEVYFPSRHAIEEGWGEVTSTSSCTDFQARRLGTRVRMPVNERPKVGWPSTVNGTAVAVPRVLEALLEYGWRDWEDGGEEGKGERAGAREGRDGREREREEEIVIPEVLWPYMGGVKSITR